MKLIGLLSWWDEPPHDLEQAIRGYHACGLTHLMCVDGAYGLFPDATPDSDPDQHQHIAEVCAEVGVEAALYVPSRTWDTETDKRGALFHLAEQRFQPTDQDWYLVIDADERVLNPFDVRPTLADTDLHGAEIHMIEPAGGGKPRRVFDIRKFFRCLPGLTTKGNHHTYLTPDGTVLWGFGQQEALDLSDLEVEHFTNLRPADRRARKAVYYDARDEHGIEQQLGCYVCDARHVYQMKSGFTYSPGKDQIRSNWHRACPEHVEELWERNREEIRERIMPYLVKGAILGADQRWRRLRTRDPVKARHYLTVEVVKRIETHDMDASLGLSMGGLLRYATEAIDDLNVFSKEVTRA